MKILIADDEEMARMRLGRMITDLHPDAQLLEAATGRRALDRVVEQSPAVVMLDIRMPDMDGVEAARHISRLEQPPWIIFTTAFHQHAMSAFDCHAVAYLLKPVRKGDLQLALQRAAALDRSRLADLQQALGAARRFLSVRTGRQLEVLPVEDILYLRAEQKYVLIGLASGEKVTDEPLRVLEQEFSECFVRVHRNALAAARHIRGLEKDRAGVWHVMFHDSAVRLPVSRRLVQKVKTALP